ncbi:MAG: YihY/virulence factor BrkB family protein [Proteobacteria bacterium]|nr:YihY/virulence factor BrkB family protein [Pseudomonadota bacterium]
MVIKKTKQKWLSIWHKYVVLPVRILRISIMDTINQDGIEHAGYLAFLSILSLFPFLIFLVSIASLLGEHAAEVNLLVSLLDNFPENITQALSPRIEEIITNPPQSLLTVAIVGIIWTASAAVEGLRTILNRAYRVKSLPPYIWRRLLSIAQFFMIIVTITATMIFLVAVPAILKKIEMVLSINFSINYDWFYLRQALIFLILLVTTSSLYYVIPNVNQRIDNTLPGSIVCIILWSVILKLFAIYLQNFNQFNLLYGSLGGVIGALMFFYLIALVFIIGAEFNYHFRRVYEIHSRSPIYK